MDRAQFRDWVSSIDELTATQRREAAAVLSDPPEGEASLAAIELGVGEERRCPHCDTGGAVSRGKSRGLCRYRCKSCGRTFDALTGTALSGLHRKEQWLAFAASLAEGETIRGAAALGILARALTAPPASGCAGPCTSRRPPAASARSCLRFAN